MVGFGIAYDAIRRLYQPDLLFHPGWMVFVVACISIVSKEVIFHYTMNAAKKLRSNLLRANAWHSRSDAISSIIVAVGVLGAIAGLEYLDSIAAIGVAFMIAKIGADFPGIVFVSWLIPDWTLKRLSVLRILSGL